MFVCYLSVFTNPVLDWQALHHHRKDRFSAPYFNLILTSRLYERSYVCLRGPNDWYLPLRGFLSGVVTQPQVPREMCTPRLVGDWLVSGCRKRLQTSWYKLRETADICKWQKLSQGHFRQPIRYYMFFHNWGFFNLTKLCHVVSSATVKFQYWSLVQPLPPSYYFLPVTNKIFIP